MPSESSQLVSNQTSSSTDSLKTEGLGTNLIVCLGLFAIALGTNILLAMDDSECDQPLNIWLRIYGVACMLGMVILVWTSLAKIFAWEISSIVFTGIFVCVALANLVLFVLGNLWFYESTDCEEEFENGFALTLAILTVYYMAIGLSILSLLLATATLVADWFRSRNQTSTQTDAEE